MINEKLRNKLKLLKEYAGNRGESVAKTYYVALNEIMKKTECVDKEELRLYVVESLTLFVQCSQGTLSEMSGEIVKIKTGHYGDSESSWSVAKKVLKCGCSNQSVRWVREQIIEEMLCSPSFFRSLTQPSPSE